MSRRKRMLEDLDQDIRDFIARQTQDSIDRGRLLDEKPLARGSAGSTMRLGGNRST